MAFVCTHEVPTTSRADVLSRIEAGDVIYGIAGNGLDKLMLVTRATPKTIYARHVTSQARAEFGRDGRSKWCEGGGNCTIVSAAPLPPDLYAIVLGLDRKMRLGQFPDGFRLSKDEIQMLKTTEQHFEARRLPTD